LALPPRRDFADRARRAPLDLRTLLLPRLFTDAGREGLLLLRDVDAFLGRLEGRCCFGFERALRKPIAFFAVAPMGCPVAAALPAIAPITPPTTAPTGPPTLPRTAPAAAPAAGLEIGGMVMFSFDCLCSLDVEFSVDSSAISSPGLMFKLRSYHRYITAASRKGINKKRPTCKSGRFLRKYLFVLAGSAIAAAVTAAAATAAAATIAAATTAAAVTTTTTTTRAAALRASFARTRFVHGQSATFHGFAIKLSDGILRFLFRRHGHKSEATRLACEFILHKHDILHGTSLCEEILKVGFRRVERKISNV
jgi:hypothetical protein